MVETSKTINAPSSLSRSSVGAFFFRRGGKKWAKRSDKSTHEDGGEIEEGEEKGRIFFDLMSNIYHTQYYERKVPGARGRKEMLALPPPCFFLWKGE